MKILIFIVCSLSLASCSNSVIINSCEAKQVLQCTTFIDKDPVKVKTFKIDKSCVYSNLFKHCKESNND